LISDSENDKKRKPMPTFEIVTNENKITSCTGINDDENSGQTTIDIDENGTGTLKIPAPNEERARYYATMHLHIHGKGVIADKVTA
jgi:hypothetical protein